MTTISADTADSAVAPPTPLELPAARVASVDVLRGLTIFLMVFVNDLGDGSPAWMRHIHPPDADGMTLADVVFPMFLFIVGVSIPLAFERAREAGIPLPARLWHIATRTASLLLMGVMTEEYQQETTLGPRTWGLLGFTALLLAWCSLPREPGTRRKVFAWLKGIGIAGLVVLLAIYRQKPSSTSLAFYGRVENWTWMRAGWWGILGLIGWSYLAASLIVLLVGRRREWLMGAMALCMTMHLAMNHGGLFSHVDSKAWLAPARGAIDLVANVVNAVGDYASLGDSFGSLAAVVMAGVLLGSILRRDSDVATPRDRVSWAATFAAGLFLAGLLTDNFEGINKIAATPTWCFWCTAIACATWILLYVIIDVARFRAWAHLFAFAGANPLVAYFLHPILTFLLGIVGLGVVHSYTGSSDPNVAVAGSLAMAATVCALTGLLSRLGLRVRL
ncbi:hypothetical protein OJF2_31010 [Aquisphaera giovannonii]|uniref:DUF5009 domain-containing protein n=1 Tax=Aquisphaera giovannonii TaxID=406548 RepID=A0A5B9W3N2_9BACT|nr:DUF5009 domain-containing protein [Aquisphaera giovannonii]QEH34560.1 hypothetical protein OJF2_31010 [Aquisphaera giovannonii]